MSNPDMPRPLDDIESAVPEGTLSDAYNSAVQFLREKDPGFPHSRHRASVDDTSAPIRLKVRNYSRDGTDPLKEVIAVRYDPESGKDLIGSDIVIGDVFDNNERRQFTPVQGVTEKQLGYIWRNRDKLLGLDTSSTGSS